MSAKNKKSSPMEVTQIKGVSERVNVLFNGSEMDPSLVNGIRRTIIGELPCYSLNGKFTLHVNTSDLNDEYLMNRVYMMPLYVDNLDDILYEKENLVFWLCAKGNNKKALLNESDEDMEVTAHMFQVFDRSGNLMDLKIEDIIKYNFPLLKLRKGREFHLEVEPSKNIGRYLSTYKGGMVTYKFENAVSMGEKEVTKRNPITNEKVETLADKQGYSKNEYNNPKNISMTIRSNGHYKALDCLKLGITTLEKKVQQLQLLLDNRNLNKKNQTPNLGTSTNETTIEIIPSTDIPNYIRIKIVDPDDIQAPLATHTIGNLVACHMNYRIEKLLKGDMDRLRTAMASYSRPHPLDEIIYLNVKAPDNLYGKDFQGNASERLLEETLNDIMNHLESIKF
jgi:DNA-directed RNA polymerase subunit L